MEQQNRSRNKLQFGMFTMLAIVAIASGLLTTLINTGFINLSSNDRQISKIEQWEQIRANSSRDAMQIWRQIQSGGNMSVVAKQQALDYELVNGRELAKHLETIRDQMETTDTGELGPIVNTGGGFYVTRVTKRIDSR